MIFKKEELDDHFPLKERLKVERAKVQSNVAYWINEYIHSHIPTANGVVDLVDFATSVTSQLESLYSDVDDVLQKYQVSDFNELYMYIESLKNQVESLYEEKEEAIRAFEGIATITDLKDMALGMEEQLKSLYSDKEV